MSGFVPADPSPRMDEHDLYPIHEEDSVPQTWRHEVLTRYLKEALAANLPGKGVTGDVCMYWEPRNFHQYAAPDVLVVDGPAPDPPPSVYLRWLDPPPLLVIEIGPRSTFRSDEGPKVETYAFLLKVPEYLYYFPERQEIRFYRMDAQGHRAVPPDARGWVYSESVDLWFGADASGWLHAYTPAGDRLLSHEEEAEARREEARARREAENRAAEAERRLAELEAELRRYRSGG